jgi:S-adenosylmethionine hydrolase
MAKTPPIITLLTDFGTRDGYVGAMKGVILGILPGAQLVDITHEVNPQDVHQAALILSDVYRYFPPSTVHLVVVDPGVGSQRQPVALGTARGRFVAPDNGVLTHVCMAEETCHPVSLTNRDYWRPVPSHTFHGRDIFSPVAAHLAKGVPLDELGTPIERLALLQLPPLSITPDSIQGEVIRMDHFGNVLTNILPLHWADESTLAFEPPDGEGDQPAPAVRLAADSALVTFGWKSLNGIHRTYSDVEVGQPIALVGSGGELEIAINQGSAQANLSVDVGDPVTLHFKPLAP